jgi:hypothetical protein
MHKSNWIPAVLTLIMVCLVSYALFVDGKPGCKQELLAMVTHGHSFIDHGKNHMSGVDNSSTPDSGCS